MSQIEKEFREQNSNKATTFENILKVFWYITLLHDAYRDGDFPDKRKCAGVTPAFKKDYQTSTRTFKNFWNT